MKTSTNLLLAHLCICVLYYFLISFGLENLTVAQSFSSMVTEDEYDEDFTSEGKEFTISDKERELKIRKLLGKGDYKAILREISDFSRIADKLSEDDFDEYVWVAMVCCVSLGDLERASRFMYDATKIKKDDFALYMARGALDCLCDNYGLAVKSFTRGIETASEDAILLIIHAHRGCVYASIRKRDLAKKDMELMKEILERLENKTQNTVASELDKEVFDHAIKTGNHFKTMLENYVNDKTGETCIMRAPKGPKGSERNPGEIGLQLFWVQDVHPIPEINE